MLRKMGLTRHIQLIAPLARQQPSSWLVRRLGPKVGGEWNPPFPTWPQSNNSRQTSLLASGELLLDLSSRVFQPQVTLIVEAKLHDLSTQPTGQLDVLHSEVAWIQAVRRRHREPTALY